MLKDMFTIVCIVVSVMVSGQMATAISIDKVVTHPDHHPDYSRSLKALNEHQEGAERLLESSHAGEAGNYHAEIQIMHDHMRERIKLEFSMTDAELDAYLALSDHDAKGRYVVMSAGAFLTFVGSAFIVFAILVFLLIITGYRLMKHNEVLQYLTVHRLGTVSETELPDSENVP